MSSTLAPPRDNLVRALSREPSLRSVNGGPPHLTGHLAVFNVWSEIDSLVEGHFMEQNAPGSFKKTFAEHAGRIKCLFQHGRDPHIGDKPLGPIESLGEDDEGAVYDVALLDTHYVSELIPGIKARLYGSSYRFDVMKEKWVERPGPSAHNPKGLPERTNLELRCYEFGPVTFPQWLEATAEMRSASRSRSMTDEMTVSGMMDEDPERFRQVVSFGRTLRDASADLRTFGEPDDEGPYRTLSLGGQSERAAAIDREVKNPRTYERAQQYMKACAWAMHPAALATVLGILDRRAKGEKLTVEEVRELIGTGSQAQDDPLDEHGDLTEESVSSDPPADPVAVIGVMGPIIPHGSLFSEVSGATSIEGLQRQFREALNDSSIKGIIFNFDSPGGDVSLVPEFAAEIFRARGTKPIWGVANTWAASAGYWLITACDEVLVTDSGEVGSIGVWSAHTDISKAMADKGLDVTLVYAGKYKVEGNSYAPLSAEAQAQMQHMVDTYYGMFTSAVATHRGVSQATVEKGFGQGRMLVASEAVKAGMADSVMTLDGAIAKMRDQLAREESAGAAGASAAATSSTSASEESGDAASGTSSSGASTFAPGATPSMELVVRSNTGGGSVSGGGVVSGGGAAGGGAVGRPNTAGGGSGGRGGLTPSGGSGTIRTDPALPSDGADLDHSTTAAGSRAQDTPTVKESSEMLTRDEMVERVKSIEARLAEIDAEYGSQALPESSWSEWEALKRERVELKAHIADKDRRVAELHDIGIGADFGDDDTGALERGTPPSSAPQRDGRRGVSRPADPFDLSTIRTSANDPGAMVRELGDRARFVLEGATFPEDVDRSKAVGRISALLERDTEGDPAYRGDIARRILVSGHPTYKRAFAKAIQGQPLTGDEATALSRALSLTDSEGGYAVPFTLDPTVISTTNGVVNPLRSIARVITITNKEWKGVTADGVTVAYSQEGTEIAEDTPTFTQPAITPERCAGFIKFSFEVGGDFAGLQTELASMFSEARDEVEADKFLSGTGHGFFQPMGLLTVLEATPSSITETETINTFDLDDLDTLESDVPPKHRPLAQYVGNRAVYNKVKSLAGDRTDIWTSIRDGLPNSPTGNLGRALNGYPANEASQMSDTVDGGEFILVLGDFRRFAIVDRVGMQVELIPHIMGANRLPTGQRGLLAWWRNSSGVLDANAFRLLKVKAS